VYLPGHTGHTSFRRHSPKRHPQQSRVRLDVPASAGQAALTQDLLQQTDAANHSGDSTLVLPGEYLEVVIRRN